MASSQDGNLGLYSGYTAGDNGWTAQHNQNWDTLDAMVQATVKSITTTAPPGSPANGDAYIVPAGATGAWASNTNKVAVWAARNSAWTLYTPKNGWQVYNQADGGDYLYNGTSWVLQGSQKLNVPQDYISGLKMVWNSATSISVTTGAAYIPSLGRLSLVNATLTLSSLSLTASTWYHLYLYENAGTPTLECVTTAPSAAYYGIARAKTGDTSRRYMGSVLTDSSGNIFSFVHDARESRIYYRAAVGGSPFMVLTNGSATTSTNISLSGCVPVTGIAVDVQFYNNDTGGATLRVGNPDMGALSSGLWMARAAANTSSQFDQCITLPTDSSQNLSYVMTGTPAGGSVGASMRCNGYTYER